MPPIHFTVQRHSHPARLGVTLIQVARYDDAMESRWERLVRDHPEARYSHSIAYKRLITEYSGFTPEYYVALQGDELVAVLPLFVKNRFPRKAASLPFADYGGVLVSPRHVDSEQEALSQIGVAIRYMLRRHALPYCELKCQFSAANEVFVKRPLHQIAQLPLREPAAMLKAVDHSVRKNIARATKSGLTVREQSDPEFIRTIFYPMYLKSMQRLSSVPHGVDFFLSAKQHFADGFKIFCAWHGSIPVACLVGWAFASRVVITQIASDDEYYQLRGPDLVHWEFIQWACAAGFQYFDFSVVRYEGQAQYKRKWGSEFKDYQLTYVTRDEGQALPALSRPVDDRTVGVRHLKPLMRHLVPLGIARHVGKPIRLFMGR